MGGEEGQPRFIEGLSQNPELEGCWKAGTDLVFGRAKLHLEQAPSMLSFGSTAMRAHTSATTTY